MWFAYASWNIVIWNEMLIELIVDCTNIKDFAKISDPMCSLYYLKSVYIQLTLLIYFN